MRVRWNVTPSEARTIAAALQTLMLQTRNRHGCASCSVVTEMGAHPRIEYVEEWQSEQGLRRQIRSDRFARLAELMEHATDRPVVTFDLAGGITRNLDYAVDVRQSPRLR